MKNKRNKKWIGAAIGLVSQGVGLVTNLISKNKQAEAEEKARQEQLALEAKQKAEQNALQTAQNLSAQFSDTSYIDEFQKRIEFKKGGNTKNDIPPIVEIEEIYEDEEPIVESPRVKIAKKEEPIIINENSKIKIPIKNEPKLAPESKNKYAKEAEKSYINNNVVWEKNINDWLKNSKNYSRQYAESIERNDPKELQNLYKELVTKNSITDRFTDRTMARGSGTVEDIKNATINNIRTAKYSESDIEEHRGGYYDPNKHLVNMRINDPRYISHEFAHAANAIPQEAAITQYKIDNFDKFKNLNDEDIDSSKEIYGRSRQFKKEHNIKDGEKISKEQLQNLKKNTKNTLNFVDRYDDDSLLYFLNDVAKNDNKQNNLKIPNMLETSYAKHGGKIKHKIEAENGEIIKSDKPMIIRNGGIAIPLGNGYNLLKGKTHEQGGIDIDLKGDGIVWSDVPFLDGESPARKVLKGENPNKVFIQQEMFKKVNNLEDDGSRKKQMGDYVTKNKRKNKINDLIYYSTKGYDTELTDNVNTAIGDYDNTTTGRLINYVENSDSLGYKNGRWYSPKVTHPRAKVDNNNFGMGVDKKQNPYIKGKIKKDSKGRQYITESNEKEARYKSIRDAKESAEQRYDYARKITKSDNELSNIKKAITESAIYNLGSGYVAKNLFNDKKLMNVLINGTDEEYNDQVNKYYKKKERNDRINKTNEFLNLKRMGGKMENNSLIYNLNGNIKNKNGFVPSTGKRQKAENGIKLGVGDWMNIGNGILNIAGGLGSYFMNRKALKDMENTGIGSGPEAPVAMQAAKLNTNYNINPQLSAIIESEANAFKDIDQNTTSSSVALARKQQARLNSLQNRNALYAEKENKETELINADRLNQQQISAQNNQAYNQYLKDKYNHQLKENEFKLGLIDKRAENNTALVQNLTSAVGNVGNYFTKKESDDKYMKFLKEIYTKRYGGKTKR